MAAALRGAVVRAAPFQQVRKLACPAVGRSVRPAVAVRSVATKAPEVAHYSNEEIGPKETLEYRIAFKQNDKVISCWHEIPLWAGEDELHFICEIPKETSAKMEVATDEPSLPIKQDTKKGKPCSRNQCHDTLTNDSIYCIDAPQDEPSTPIKQDTKKGKLRFYPYNINWNYGLLPQTWEDPSHKNEDLGGVAGDNDPVDVVEIGSAQLKMGGVYRVKPLGVYAMIDDGELDWKVIAINSADPKAAAVNSLEDVEREFPGQLTAILEWFRNCKIPEPMILPRANLDPFNITEFPGQLTAILEWFRDYKIPDGKPANAFGYDNKCMDKAFTLKVIEETHTFYNKLKSGRRANSEELSLI
uniref:inorganic diphosphatase n=1 Tax=Tetradesmus obliquus TaxID=3088 RepID=A0A383VA06_TETOB